MTQATEAPTQEAIQTEKQNETSTEQLPEVLTVDEVARLRRVNRKTVYAAIQRRELPGARHVGSTIRILRDAVLRWMADSQAGVSLAKKGGAR